ncbi:MAG: hypothetical protein JJ866_23800 [Roseibium sp.]|uniref:sulfotransferase family 2 domain-containing protein n=1 Tax=Roseibium sp. TaxID=1936156 RepID=UPI001AFCDB4C|nr:sulfotransferase family 2 domain-containing protein [Roseibium sp.]MBO6894981.1 hypothetical protein [Roseibium sp.]MBO6929073.1 hypothetical protein [Roseibium sp.]
MFSRVYTIFDRRRRPLRNHVYLAFPDHNIAYARITEPAFRALCPVLHALAGLSEVTPDDALENNGADYSERLLFHGNVELLTARELKRRYPDMTIVAWVQDPLERLAYCYEKVILADTPLPSYYSERHFHKDMSPQEFVSHVELISDLEADNLFRSQTAALTYKGSLTADIVLLLEQYEESLDMFLSEISLKAKPRSTARYRISDYVSHSTLRSFKDDWLSRKLRNRYKSDYDLFYSKELAQA